MGDSVNKYDISKLIENPLNYVNEHFPDEYSLCGIDTLISELSSEVAHQDALLIEMLQDKAISDQIAHERFEKLQCATNDLMTQLSDIHAQTQKCETSLKVLSADIRALHRAKTNICDTIIALKRLLMLSTTLEDLSEKARNRKYGEASGLVFVLRELRELVAPLSGSLPVSKLLGSCDMVLEQLQQQLTEDLEVLLGISGGGNSLGTLLELSDVCKCSDAVGSSIRKYISSKYAKHITQSYENVFALGLDINGLDNINHRFAWLRRCINDLDERFGDGIPASWGLQSTIAWAFVEILRTQLMELLTKSHEVLGANCLLTCLLKCREFEQEIDCRLTHYGSGKATPDRPKVEFPEVMSETKISDESEPLKSLRGSLSRCFESYLSPWIAAEETQLMDLFARITTSSHCDDSIMLVLCSSRELFSALSARSRATLAISREQILFEMFLVFKRLVGKYQQHLQNRVNKLNRHSDLESLAKSSGCIAATCDYCLENLSHLCEEITEAIASAYRELVSFSSEREKLSATKSDAIKGFIVEICKFGSTLVSSNKTVEVSGPSEEVRKLERRVLQAIELTKVYFPQSYLHYITNKIARAVVSHFKNSLFSLTSVTEASSQQLLLDAYGITEFLLKDVKTLVDPLPYGYINAVSSEMDKLQALTKVLNTAEHLPNAYQALLIESGGMCTKEELDSMLKIKRKPN